MCFGRNFSTFYLKPNVTYAMAGFAKREELWIVPDNICKSQDPQPGKEP